jgi:hypothetical protein
MLKAWYHMGHFYTMADVQAVNCPSWFIHVGNSHEHYQLCIGISAAHVLLIVEAGAQALFYPKREISKSHTPAATPASTHCGRDRYHLRF